MEKDNIFKLDLSLENVAAISAAIGFWERPDVKEKMESDFSGVSDFYYDPDDFGHQNDKKGMSSGQHVINYIFGKLDLLNYPEKLIRQLKSLVVKIGKKIYYWRDYVVKNLKLDLRYADTIYWSPYGEIDELKILQEFWFKDPDFQCGINCNCTIYDGTFCMISKLALEGSVREKFEAVNGFLHESSIVFYLSDTVQREIAKRYSPDVIIATHIVLCASQSGTIDDDDLEDFKAAPDEFPKEDLCKICISNNLQFAAKYFFDKLKLEEKKVFINEVALSYSGSNNSDPRKELAAKMLLHFLNGMAEEAEKLQFLTMDFPSIFQLLMSVWPYQEICEKLLDKIVDYVPEDHQSLLQICMSYLTQKNNRSDYVLSKNFYNRIFLILLDRISLRLKERFFIVFNYRAIENLYQAPNYDILSIVLHDSHLKIHKSKILIMGLKYLKNSVHEGNYNGINKFFKVCKLSEEEIESLKKELNFVNVFLSSGMINSADVNLKWLVDSEEERTKLKNGVDAVKIFSVLIESNKFGAANDFLMWRFDSEKERTEVKEIFKSDEFLRNKIFKIWCCDHSKARTDLMIDESEIFLNLFLESEANVLDFRRNKILLDEFFIEKYWDLSCYDKNLNNLDNLLKFCLCTSDDINEIKRRIANNINFWIDAYAVKADKFEMVEALLGWVFANETENKRVFEKYMNSPSGIDFCIRIFNKCTPSRIVNFFNSWINPSFDISEMFVHLDKCDRNLVHDGVISCVRILLKKREQKRLIKMEELVRLIKIWRA